MKWGKIRNSWRYYVEKRIYIKLMWISAIILLFLIIQKGSIVDTMLMVFTLYYLYWGEKHGRNRNN